MIIYIPVDVRVWIFLCWLSDAECLSHLCRRLLVHTFRSSVWLLPGLPSYHLQLSSSCCPLSSDACGTAGPLWCL